MNKFDNFPKINKKDVEGRETPFFLIDQSIIKTRYELIKKNLTKSWGTKNIIAYSFKTNYKIGEEFKKQKIETYAEVVSKMEYQKAKTAGYLDSQIIYNGPNKENLMEVLKYPTMINLDNFTELETVIEQKKNIKSMIGLRLNSELKASRFGFNIENGEAELAIKKLNEAGIKIRGLHIHLGFFTSPKIYKLISKKIIKFIQKNNLNIEYIDFGGGFPSHGDKPYGYKKLPYYPIDDYISQICKPLNNFYRNKNKPFLILEPGRFLVDDSAILVSRVLDIKTGKNSQKIILDATNNMLSSVWFRPQIIKIFETKSRKKISTIIYGSSCQEDDILYQGKLPTIKVGDLVIFYCVGAYNQNMNGDFIFPKTGHFFKKN